MDRIPTTGGAVPVLLKCGGVAYVRKPKRSVLTNIATAAQFTGEMHSAMRYGDLLCRWAIIGADNLADADSNATVIFSTERVGALGPIASLAVLDALSTEDVNAVLEACGAGLCGEGDTGPLTGEQTKNS